jgi:hypothetical protein
MNARFSNVLYKLSVLEVSVIFEEWIGGLWRTNPKARAEAQ